MAFAIKKSNLYPGTFTKDVICNAGATTSLTPGVFTLIGEYTVQADECVGIGRGSFAALDQAIGRLYAAFYDNSQTPVAITNGQLRIMLVSSQDMPIGNRPVYLDVDLAQITSGATVPSERYVLPFEEVMLSKDKKIQFLIKNNGSTAVTLSAANSTALCDITRALI